MHRSPRILQAIRPGNARLMACLALLALLGACESLPQTGSSDGDTRYTENRARRLEQSGRHEQAAELYEQIAARSTRADEFWLRAAGQWHAAGNWQDTLRALGEITGPLEPRPQERRILLGASAAISAGQAQAAADWLAEAPEPPPDRLRSPLMWQQVRLALLQSDVLRAIEIAEQREIWLANAQEVRQGRQALLTLLSDPELLARAPVAPDQAESPEGWLALARILAEADRDPFVVRSALRGWQEDFDAHPAEILLPQLLQEYRQLLDYPQRVAVLLPMSGRFAFAGNAIRDGILAGYLRHDEARPSLRFYDTSLAAIDELYGRAVLDGADFVIGPLQRSAVEALGSLAELPVPVLALNSATENAVLPGYYQFGLAPEDEARQVARRLLAEGKVQGIALVPSSDWGTRVLDAFRGEFDEGGGILLDYQNYDRREDDYSGPITTVLHLAESHARHRALSGVLGKRIEFEPRRRQDVQFVFVGAQPEAGRLLRPQLRFHYASNLPVYATSAIYEDRPERNGDLNGIAFVDIPLVIGTDDRTARMRADLDRAFGEKMRSRPRLYALGFDAYRLVPALFSGRMLEDVSIAGLTGELMLTRDGQIQRELVWARFEGGVPVPLEEPAPERIADRIPSP